MSSRAMGCDRVVTHLGQTMAGNRSTSWRMISKAIAPPPMTMAACNSTVSAVSRRTAPTSWRLRRWSDARRWPPVAQAAEVDDLDLVAAGGGAERLGRLPVTRDEVPAAGHPVDQVVGDVGALQGGVEGGRSSTSKRTATPGPP